MSESRLALRRAIEAVNHLTDPVPPWMDILQTARELVGADSGTLILFDSNRTLLNLTAVGLSEQSTEDYNGYFYSRDILERDSRYAPAGTWLNTDEMYGSNELQRTEFFADYMLKHRMAQILSLIVESNPMLHATIGFQRATVDSNAKSRLKSGEVADYFRILRRQLAGRQHALNAGLQSIETAFSTLGEGVLLMTIGGIVIKTSPLAKEYIDNGDGWMIRGGRLQHRAQEVQTLLECQCSATATDRQTRTMATTAGWGKVILVDIVVAPEYLSLVGGCLLLVRMRRKSAFTPPDIDKLASVFSITCAEATVLAELAAGHSVEEIATLRKASVLTVRKQIASLMKKMECNRQSELVRLASLL